MTDKDRHFFYLDSAKAKAAYLKDEEGKIVARAVLFTEVTDQDNRRWRLLERQYTTGEDEDVYKRQVEGIFKSLSIIVGSLGSSTFECV